MNADESLNRTLRITTGAILALLHAGGGVVVAMSDTVTTPEKLMIIGAAALIAAGLTVAWLHRRHRPRRDTAFQVHRTAVTTPDGTLLWRPAPAEGPVHALLDPHGAPHCTIRHLANPDGQRIITVHAPDGHPLGRAESSHGLRRNGLFTFHDGTGRPYAYLELRIATAGLIRTRLTMRPYGETRPCGTFDIDLATPGAGTFTVDPALPEHQQVLYAAFILGFDTITARAFHL